MQKLLVRHENATELETRARQQTVSRTQTKSAQSVHTGIAPPPAAELLGSWQIIQEEYRATGIYHVKASLGEKVMTFEQLSDKQIVTGVAYYSDFSVLGPQDFGIYPYVVSYSIVGQICHHRVCEFLQSPIDGDLANLRGVTVFYYPLAVRVTWEGNCMYGEIKNDSVGLNILFRAVRRQEEQRGTYDIV